VAVVWDGRVWLVLVFCLSGWCGNVRLWVVLGGLFGVWICTVWSCVVVVVSLLCLIACWRCVSRSVIFGFDLLVFFCL